MAYEVVKQVGKRAYRYRVESYRDSETRKVRSRWTYLGTSAAASEGGAPAGSPPIARRSPAHTRERLVRAFERLSATRSYANLTAGMVAAEAGLAHGTFYRYFKDKHAVLMAALDRIREQLERERPTFDPPFGPLDRERRRVRTWLETSLGTPAEHPGVLRAYFELLETDLSLRELRVRRTAERTAALAAYLRSLAGAGLVELGDPGALAAAFIALTDAVFREATLARGPVDANILAGVAIVFDRAIFAAGASAPAA